MTEAAAVIVPAPKFAGLQSHACARCAHEDLTKPVFVALDGAVIAVGPRCAAALVYGTTTKATVSKVIAIAAKKTEEAARTARAAETAAVVAFALAETGLEAEHAAASMPGIVAQKALDAFGGLAGARAAYAAR